MFSRKVRRKPGPRAGECVYLRSAFRPELRVNQSRAATVSNVNSDGTYQIAFTNDLLTSDQSLNHVPLENLLVGQDARNELLREERKAAAAAECLQEVQQADAPAAAEQVLGPEEPGSGLQLQVHTMDGEAIAVSAGAPSSTVWELKTRIQAASRSGLPAAMQVGRTALNGALADCP
jgi:hypothetical protein